MLKVRNHNTVFWFMFGLILGASFLTSWAEASHLPNKIRLGQLNISVKELNKVIISTLKQKFPHPTEATTLQIPLPDIEQQYVLPKQATGMLKQLGASDSVFIYTKGTTVNIPLSPDLINIGFSSSATGIHWNASLNIKYITVQNKKMALVIPSGLFNRQVNLVTNNSQINLDSYGDKMQLQLSGSVDLANGTATPLLAKVSSNISTLEIMPLLSLGSLLVNGKPLSVTIQSGASQVVMQEASLRNEIETISQQWIQNMLASADVLIQEKVFEESLKISPIQLEQKINIEEMVQDVPSEIKQAISGIEVQIKPSNLRTVQNNNIVSSNIDVQMMVEGKPVLATHTLTPNELAPTYQNSGNLLTVQLRESGLQDILHNTEIQKRLKTLVRSIMKRPGAKLSDALFGVHMLPNKKVLAVVLNLEIDIKSTGKPNISAAEIARLKLGNFIERYFGSGKIVKIPVELWVNIESITYPKNSETGFLNIKIDYPFRKTPYRNNFNAPSNLDKMTSLVRDQFIGDVEADIRESVPEKIQIPIPRYFDVLDQKLQIKDVSFETNESIKVTIHPASEATL